MPIAVTDPSAVEYTDTSATVPKGTFKGIPQGPKSVAVTDPSKVKYTDAAAAKPPSPKTAAGWVTSDLSPAEAKAAAATPGPKWLGKALQYDPTRTPLGEKVGEEMGAHPYITAGLIGAATGGAGDIPMVGPALEAAGPLGQVGLRGLSAGQQVISQKSSEWLQRLAQTLAPDHPLVQEGAGILGGLLPGGLTPIGRKLSGSLVGAGDIASEAEAAKAAVAKKALPSEYEPTEEGFGQSIDKAQAQMDRTKLEAQQALSKNLAGVEPGVNKDYLADAKRLAVRQAAGPAADYAPTQFKDDVDFARQNWGQDWAARLEKTLPPKVLNKSLGGSVLANTTSEVQSQTGTYSKNMQSLINTINQGVTGDSPANLAVTPANLLKFRNQATALLKSPQDREAAQRLITGIDDTLGSIRGSAATNKIAAELDTHRANFKGLDAVAGAPLQSASKIFSNPDSVQALLQHGGENGRARLGDLYAQMVENGGAVSPQHAKFLGAMYGAPFKDPKAWVFQKEALDNLSDRLKGNPELQQRYDQLVQDGKNEALEKYWKSMSAQAIKDAKLFGPMGDQLEKNIIDKQRVGDWQGAMNVARDFYNKATPEAAMQAMQGKQTEAAMKAIQSGYKPTATWNYWKRRLSWMGPMAAGGAMMGHVSPYAAVGVGLSGAVGAREGLSYGLRYALKHSDAAAKAFYEASMRPGAPQSLGTIARMVARADLAAAAAKANINLDDNPDSASARSPAPAKPGPAMQALTRMKAENIAPTPSGADRAVKLGKDLAKKSPPDVQRDLAAGRLSVEEVKKILQEHSDIQPQQIVYGMPLADALTAVEMGTPQEKQVLLPLLVQRFQQELPKVANKTMQAKLAQRLQKLMAEDHMPPPDAGEPLPEEPEPNESMMTQAPDEPDEPDQPPDDQAA